MKILKIEDVLKRLFFFGISTNVIHIKWQKVLSNPRADVINALK